MPTPDPKPQTLNPRRRTAAHGFTLIEAALTMVIVGVGVLAMVSAQQAYHQKNDWAQRTGTAALLANELRELTLTLPHHDPITGTDTVGVESNETGGVADWDDLDDFAGTVSGGFLGGGVTFSPPINALRLPVAGLDKWSQVVRVAKVRPDNLADETGVSLKDDSDFMRVSVDVMHRPAGAAADELIYQLSWVVAD